MARFSWDGMDAAFQKVASAIEAAAHTPTLLPNLGTTDLLILADNLQALASLHIHGTSFEGIYIDPPYNTGNRFAYDDRFSTDAWLSMMLPRITLARNLMTDDGVFFMSIGDRGLTNATLLLEMVFGAKSRVATIVVSSNPKGRQLARHFALCHEYLLVFAKDPSRCSLEAASEDGINEKNFPHQDGAGRYRELPLRNTNKKFNPSTRPNLYYPLYVTPSTGRVWVEKRKGRMEVFPVFGSGKPAVWRWSKGKSRSESTQLHGRIVKGTQGPRWDVFQKDYLFPGRKKKLSSVWLADEIGSTDDAARELKARGAERFDTPKPLKLMERIVSMIPENARVLDFFAGSGTTGEAVWSLNALGANRRFVLVQEERSSATGEDLGQLIQRRLDASPMRRSYKTLSMG